MSFASARAGAGAPVYWYSSGQGKTEENRCFFLSDTFSYERRPRDFIPSSPISTPAIFFLSPG